MKPARSLIRTMTPAVFSACLVLLSGRTIAQAQNLDGKAIAFDRSKGNCLSCHNIPGGDLPGTIGPALADLKSKYPNRQDVVDIIHDETRRNPQTVMPPFGRNLILTDQEISAVVDFLYSP